MKLTKLTKTPQARLRIFNTVLYRRRQWTLCWITRRGKKVHRNRGSVKVNRAGCLQSGSQSSAVCSQITEYRIALCSSLTFEAHHTCQRKVNYTCFATTFLP